MRERIAVLALALYVMAGVVTFGHSVSNFEPDVSSSRAINNQHREFGAVLAAVAWPFYWSFVFWKKNDA